jgi:hypothetical protein
LENNKSEQEFHLEKSVMLGKNDVPFEKVVNSLKRVLTESGKYIEEIFHGTREGK